MVVLAGSFKVGLAMSMTRPVAKKYLYQGFLIFRFRDGDLLSLGLEGLDGVNDLEIFIMGGFFRRGEIIVLEEDIVLFWCFF